MSMSLAVKYRPQCFEDVVSQESIIKILNRQLELNKIHNTYLFCGASGCGKTTTARIFVNKINNNIGMPIEIDGASNNGVDNVREIVTSAKERSLDSEYKCYIIDECQMLSNSAWNSFLKCIEEPPKYTIFIFCTTDPQKIPATILNRCMRFNFNKIPSDKIANRLEYICNQEGFTDFNYTCEYISKICNNQMRDAISLLEKVSDYDTNLSIQNAINALGNYSYDTFIDIIDFINHHAQGMTLETIEKIYQEGNDMKLFVESFLTFCLDFTKYLILKSFDTTSFPITLKNHIDEILVDNHDVLHYNRIIDYILELKNMIKNDTNIKSTIEAMFIRICNEQ